MTRTTTTAARCIWVPDPSRANHCSGISLSMLRAPRGLGVESCADTVGAVARSNAPEGIEQSAVCKVLMEASRCSRASVLATAQTLACPGLECCDAILHPILAIRRRDFLKSHS